MEEILYLAIGSVVGAVLTPRIRPMLIGVLSAGYKVADAVSSKTVEQRKSIEGVFADWRKEWDGFVAEARAKARKPARSGAPAKA